LNTSYPIQTNCSYIIRPASAKPNIQLPQHQKRPINELCKGTNGQGAALIIPEALHG
jgi:hypothetical protein